MISVAPEVIEWWQRPEWWTVVSAALTFLAALIYTGFTLWMVLETRWLRQLQSEPTLIVRLERDDRGCLYLLLKNVGNGPAYDVQPMLHAPYDVDEFRRDGEAVSSNGLYQMKDGPFVTGVPVIAPRDEVRQWLGHERNFWPHWGTSVGTLGVEYRHDGSKKPIAVERHIDIRVIDPRRLGSERKA